ncbi:TetR/AcrR family transcriptional regulator C-terminal domain-containing protein, partial [Streptomyces sp. NPDC006356]
TLRFHSADGRELTSTEVAQQFLGMIGGQLLWPQLVQHDFIPPGPTETTVVDEAVTLMVSRYGTAV